MGNLQRISLPWPGWPRGWRAQPETRGLLGADRRAIAAASTDEHDDTAQSDHHAADRDVRACDGDGRPTDRRGPPTAPTAVASPTATTPPLPQKPRVVADSAANLRGGPGTSYPMIGQMAAGKEVDIIGRNGSGDWWRIAWDGAGQAWVAGLVVRVLGPIDTVAVAKDIPVLPTRPPAGPPTAPPKPVGPDFQLVSVHVWGVEENGGFYDGPSVQRRETRITHQSVGRSRKSAQWGHS